MMFFQYTLNDVSCSILGRFGTAILRSPEVRANEESDLYGSDLPRQICDNMTETCAAFLTPKIVSWDAMSNVTKNG